MNSITSSALVTVWLALIWYGVKCFEPSGAIRSLADRLRYTIVAALFFSSVLGLARLLYFAPLFALAVALATYRFVTEDRSGSIVNSDTTFKRYLWAFPVVLTVIVGWPGLSRPILDGDSMSYHLPNAAAWATAHSLWVATTNYWWYPPGSELFASSLLIVGGPASLGLAGSLAFLLLTLRLTEIFATNGATPWTASTLACAVTSLPVIALQASTLQNDVWLAAWLLEGFAAADHRKPANSIGWAVASLIKPVGFAFVAVAAAARRTNWKTFVWLAAPFIIWNIRNAVLVHDGSRLVIKEDLATLFETTIAAQGFAGLTSFIAAAVAQGIGFVTLLAAVLCSPVLLRDRSSRIMPYAYLALFFFEPFGFKSNVPQLAGGHSLRFAIPSLVFGSLSFTSINKRLEIPIAATALILTLSQIWTVLSIFWNDLNVHGVLFAAGAVTIAIALSKSWRRYLVPITLASITSYAMSLDSSPSRYSDVTLDTNGSRSRAYDWLAARAAKSIVVVDTDAGLVVESSPHSVVVEAELPRACAEARVRGSLLFITAQRTPKNQSEYPRLAEARTCGRVIYEEPKALVIQP